jgi:hypothetical protein
MKILVCFALLISSVVLYSQSKIYQERISWCGAKCKAAGDEMKNTKSLYMSRFAPSSEKKARPSLKFTDNRKKSTVFPVKVGIVSKNGRQQISDQTIQKTIQILNEGFRNTDIKFELESIKSITDDLTIESLQEENYAPYLGFSTQHDDPTIISIYIFDYEPELCEVTPTSISCGRTGGFSFIYSSMANNIVLSKFDLLDDRVIVHEMGHFFGLYHTFEEDQFGKDNFVEDCNVAGDCICDTPPDPGAVYEVYIHHSLCKMQGFKHENRNEYLPHINNYMSYYKPCYMKKYEFTEGQRQVLKMSAMSDLRQIFAKK